MRRFKTQQLIIAAILFAGIGLGGCPCIRAFDVPAYQTIRANETAFLIPLEGATGKQAKFDSAEQIEKLKVATKRVQITHRWNQTGRNVAGTGANSGEWIDDVILIKVDRTPVTREWTADEKTGTAKKDQGIWVESKDSVGFSTGFSVTAQIEEKNTALFLYRYPNRSLAQIVDGEIRARVQKVVSSVAASYDMSQLREQKSTMIVELEKDLLPFFEGRGITITTIGNFGGFSYENPKIQESIDAVFISQRKKEVNAALLAAQKDLNAQITMEADALAERERKIAKGIADGKQMLLDVAKNAASDPVFLEMRKLEVDEKRIEKWNGAYPTYMMQTGGGDGSAPTLLLSVPTPR